VKRFAGIDFGFGLALVASLLSFLLALTAPYFLGMFWQIPDGVEILRGHLPDRIDYAVSAGPLLSQEWLFEAGLAWAVQHGSYGAFVMLCAAAAAATPLLIYAAVRALGIGDVAAGVVALLSAGGRFAGSAIRPETFAVDCFALELFLLAGARRRIWLLPCVVLWANVHASVVLAPLAAFAYAAGEWFARRSLDSCVRRSIGVVAAVTLATLVTPYGPRLWVYAINLTLTPNPARAHLEAWRALAFDDPDAWTAVLPGLLLLVAAGIDRRRRDAGWLMIAALCLALTITHARFATFLVVGWAAVIARALDARAGLSGVAAGRPRASVLAVVPLALYTLASGLPKLWTPAEPSGPWQPAAEIVAAHGLHGNTYAPYVWAAYLHWRGLPVRLLIDGHGDPYPKDVWDDHLALQEARPNWREILSRRRIAVVIVPADAPLAQALRLDPAWRRVDARGGVVAFEPLL
jgi:hypothetical protein